MEIVSLDNLNQMDFSVTKVLSMFQYWKEGAVFSAFSSPKENHAFLFFSGCDGLYTFPDGTSLLATRGDVVYIPYGVCYKTTFFNKREHLATILINFQLHCNDEMLALSDRVTVIAKDTQKTFNRLFYKTAQESSSARASTATLKANLYRVFEELQKCSEEGVAVNDAYSKIAKGIYYLEHDSDQLLSIDEVAAMCDVSGNTFRRLFHAYAGMSPIEYRLQRKIQRAQQLLESQNFTVSEVGEMLGFSDVSYFSRVFKNKTGSSPVDYLKRKR